MMSTNEIQMTEQPFPADLQALLNELERADQEARQLASGLTEAQLNWQPGGGTGWSVAQCLDHLARINTVYIAALRTAVHAVKPGTVPRGGPIQPGWFGRWFIGAMEPPPRRKLKAPKKALPAAHKDGADVLRAFVKAHDEVRSLIQEARDMDLNRVRFTNPFIRLFHFTVGTGLLIIAAHDRRHLWQARQVCKAMEAERAGG
jgi:DinB superfamily